MQDERTIVVHRASELVGLPTRRGFLKALGMGGTLVLMPSVFAACTDTSTPITGPSTDAQTISLGTDVGVFTFAYVLEQLESAYYEQVVRLPNFGSLFPAADQAMLTDIRNDEVLHREFLRAILGTSFPDLAFDFSSLGTNLTRTALLTTAMTLEVNGIAAYNGAGSALKNAKNLLVAGKIVSVEARHTSAIGDSLDGNGGTLYADLTKVPGNLGAVVADALDAAVAMESTVAANAQPFIRNKITLTA